MNKTSATENLNTAHLSADQIDDHLIGDLAAEAAAHLATCDHCKALVSAASEPIANFQAMSQAWSERRSATLPVYLPEPSLQPHHMALRVAAGATAAVILMMGVSMPTAYRASATQTASTQSEPTAQPQALTEMASSGPTEMASAEQPISRDHTSERISQDNRMLQDIDTALDISNESSSSLGLEPVDTQTQPQTRLMSLQD